MWKLLLICNVIFAVALAKGLANSKNETDVTETDMETTTFYTVPDLDFTSTKYGHSNETETSTSTSTSTTTTTTSSKILEPKELGSNSSLTKRESKDVPLPLQSLDFDKEAEASFDNWVKPPVWLTVDTLKKNPGLILNVTEEDFNTKVLSLVDLFQECLEDWEAPRILQTSFPYYHAGYDEENRAVWIAETGKFEVRKILDGGGEPLALLDKYIRQAAYRVMKSIISKLSQENRNIEVRIVLDFEGLNVASILHLPTVRFGMKYARRLSQILANHMGPSVVINANYAAETVLNIGKPIMPSVLANLEVYGTNKARWLPRLQNHFPREILPEWYGGSKDFKPLNVYG